MRKTNAEAKEGFAKDVGENRDDLGMKTRECGALSAKAGKLKEELEILRETSKTSEKKIGEHES